MASELSTGQLIAGRYRLRRRLGAGGMGSVWEAADSKLRRRVAIKLLLTRHTGDSDALRRFEREAMAIARLRSPHIAQVHDYGVEHGRPYMVMELLDGETLTERLRRVRRLKLTQAARLAKHLGKALATAHDHGIIHRDLKPGNVFMVCDHDDDLVKVFDFGISKVLEPLREASLTRDNAVVGTPRFMSPEQISGATVDARTDLWSFGVTLYCACTGHIPFQGADLRQVVQAVLGAAPAPVRLFGDASLPPALDGFFARALAKEPDDRFSDALDMASAFVRIVAPELHSAPPPARLPALADVDRTHRIVPPPLPKRRPKPAPAADVTMTIDRPSGARAGWRAVAAASSVLVLSIAGGLWFTQSRAVALPRIESQLSAAAAAAYTLPEPTASAAPSVVEPDVAAGPPQPARNASRAAKPAPPPAPPIASASTTAAPAGAPTTAAPASPPPAAAPARPSTTTGPHQLFQQPR